MLENLKHDHRILDEKCNALSASLPGAATCSVASLALFDLPQVEAASHAFAVYKIKLFQTPCKTDLNMRAIFSYII